MCIGWIFVVSKCDFNPEGSIDCGESLSGTTTQAGEVQNYTFELTDEYPVVQISTCGSNFDTYLYFWDSDGDLIQSCDDCGSCGLSTVLTFDNLDTGSYYIGVGGCCGDYGTYILDITCANTTSPPITTPDGGINEYEDWECNHILTFPLPLPCLYTGSLSVIAECNDDDDGVDVTYYNTNDCSGDINRTETFDSDEFGEDGIVCTYDDSCGYYSYSLYNGENNCGDDDNLFATQYSVIGECISYDSYGYSYLTTCESNGDLTTIAYDCADCDSDCQDSSVVVNFYDQFNDTVCVEVEYFECFFFVFWRVYF